MIRFSVIASAMLLTAATAAWGAPTPAEKTPASGADTTADLDPDPVVSDAMGLQIRLPIGAMVQQKKVQTVPTIIATDGASPPAWRMGIQPAMATDGTATAQLLAEEQIARLKAAVADVQIIDSHAVRYSDHDGWIFWVRNPPANPEVEPMISGWMALPTGPETFVTFLLGITADRFDSVRPLLVASFETIDLKTLSEIDDSKRSSMLAGLALLESFTPERLHAAVGEDQWYRLYQPEPGGAQEIAILHVRTAQGKRGAIESGRDESRFKGVDHEIGLLVTVSSRFVGNAEKGLYYDSEFRQWMKWDRSEEAWSLLFTARQNDAVTTEAITGLRTGPVESPDRTPPKLTVIQSNSTSRSRDDTSWEVPESYLSQAEHWLLGRLLPKDRNGPQEFGYYFFVNSKMELARRTDRWEPVADGRGTPSAVQSHLGTQTAAWKLSTTIPGSGDKQPDISYFDTQGNLVRQVRSNGAIVEPMSPEQLRELWDRKGLMWSTPTR